MFAGSANVLKNEKSINIRDLFLRLGRTYNWQELQSSREAFVQAELERVVIVHAAAMPRRTTVAAKKVSTAATNRLLIAARPGNPRPPPLVPHGGHNSSLHKGDISRATHDRRVAPRFERSWLSALLRTPLNAGAIIGTEPEKDKPHRSAFRSANQPGTAQLPSPRPHALKQ
jgi:hypothetical protein